jgi:hypothetical protein
MYDDNKTAAIFVIKNKLRRMYNSAESYTTEYKLDTSLTVEDKIKQLNVDRAAGVLESLQYQDLLKGLESEKNCKLSELDEKIKLLDKVVNEHMSNVHE